jgi:type II secretory pathway component PulC
MALTIRYNVLLRKAGWCLLLVGLLVLVWLIRAHLALPDLEPAADRPVHAAVWPAVGQRPDVDWTIFRSGQGVRAEAAAGRFRLAGTFFAYDQAHRSKRTAILDDLREKTQFLVREADSIGSVRVLSISHNRVVLSDSGKEVVLWLSFQDETGERSARGKRRTVADALAAAPAIETSRFGKRVGERRWVFDREKLMGYYQEVVSDPGRLASLFASLKPLYDKQHDQRRISGYHLDVEGEADFFGAVGLEQGDVVRKVNSIPMTSQRRAEYFIREFIGNRMNAIVLDIERGEGEQKLIYMVR